MERSQAVTAVFDPVHSNSTFEETVERLGTAIRLGLLAAGERLPSERELSDRLRISRSTLRQAITTLVQSGHLVSLRGRTGGTFVTESPPLADRPPPALAGEWRDRLDWRLAIETGCVELAVARIGAESLERLEALIAEMEGAYDHFETYRRADVRFHLAIAEGTRVPRLVAAMTDVQDAMSVLIAFIAHPPAVLAEANRQHSQLLAALRRGDRSRALAIVRKHLEGTEHILAGLMPQ
ncbi:MAG: FadR family transcriptional regulator [Solirubrobacterales bacterium]|nr:FadR family transcriptional regulator [Solirubrobacterales bacterium]